MAPTIHLVRHAQGFHDVTQGGESIHDPLLTEEGEDQAKRLCEQFPHHDKIDLLAASPMKRSIQTCSIGFQPALDAGHKILLMPLAQEGSDEPMDTGSTQDEILAAFPNVLDPARLHLFPYWHHNKGTFDVSSSALINRALQLRRVLRERPEKHIALVSHGQFAHFVAGNVSEAGEQTTRQWANAEWRSYQFLTDDDEEAQLGELQESIDRRPDLEKQDCGFVLSNDGAREGENGEVLAN